MGELVKPFDPFKAANPGKTVRQAEAELKKQEAAAVSEKNANSKVVNAQIEQAKQKQANETVTGGNSSSDQRDVPCPFCAGHVKKKDVTGGKKEWKIPFTNPPYRIPIPPFLAKILQPDPKECVCKGEQKIKDVTDDSAKYQRVQQAAQANIEKSIELEAKMGTGGNRTTYIEKSDTLMVGLGFNRNDSYEIVPEGHYSPGKFATKGKTNIKNGAAFAEGFKSNAVVGKQTSPGWPSAVGNYVIKCANKYQLLTGAGGIAMSTKGPLTINAGILSITGPQVTIGSSTGPLTLEGDVVSITGKTITMTPTGDANVYVRGTMSTTGNIVVGGQLHAETLSFCKASCPGTEARTTPESATPADTQTFPASWGGVGMKGITTSVMDIVIYLQNIVTDFETAAVKVVSPAEKLDLTNRMGTLAKMIIPTELTPTGFVYGVMPGPAVLPIFNFPHTHGLPSMKHTHGVTVPDMDYKNYSSPQAVRAKVINKSLVSNAPVVPSNKLQDAWEFAVRLPGWAANTVIQAQKLKQWVTQTLT